MFLLEIDNVILEAVEVMASFHILPEMEKVNSQKEFRKLSDII